MKKEGFTIIEIIVVLALMSIMSSMVYVGAVKINHKIEDIEFKEIIRDVKEFIHITKAEAMYADESMYILIDKKNNQLISHFKTREKEIYNLKSGYKFTDSSSQKIYIYNRDGYELGGNIRVTNNKGEIKRLSIKAITGFIEVVETKEELIL